MIAFKKLSKSELEALGKSPKAESWRGSDGKIYSKRQYQKARQIGTYNKGQKSELKAHPGRRGKSPEQLLQYAKEQAARERKRGKIGKPYQLTEDNERGDYSIEITDLPSREAAYKALFKLIQDKKPDTPAYVQIAFKADEKLLLESKYEFRDDQPDGKKDRLWKSVAGRWPGHKKNPNAYLKQRMEKALNNALKNGIRPAKRTTYTVNISFDKPW